MEVDAFLPCVVFLERRLPRVLTIDLLPLLRHTCNICTLRVALLFSLCHNKMFGLIYLLFTLAQSAGMHADKLANLQSQQCNFLFKQCCGLLAWVCPVGCPGTPLSDCMCHCSHLGLRKKPPSSESSSSQNSMSLCLPRHNRLLSVPKHSSSSGKPAALHSAFEEDRSY